MCPKLRKMLEKSTSEKQEKERVQSTLVQPPYCKYPHLFDLDKLAYDRLFGRTESVTDQALEFYKKLLPVVPAEPQIETKVYI